MKICIWLAIWFIGLYLLGAFVAWDLLWLAPADWGVSDRLGFLFGMIIWGILCVLAKDVAESKI